MSLKISEYGPWEDILHQTPPMLFQAPFLFLGMASVLAFQISPIKKNRHHLYMT